MNILIITDMFETDSKAPSIRGVFIRKRLEQLKVFSINYKSYAPVVYDSCLLKSLRKIMKNEERKPFTPSKSSKLFKPVEVYRSLCSIIVKKIKYEKYLQQIANKIANKLYEFFIKDQPNLIHAHGMYTYIGGGAGTISMLLSQKLHVPYIVTLHGSDVNYEMAKAKKLFINVFENASKVIFVSDALRKRAIKYGYNGEDAIVIPNGYDPEIFYPMNKNSIRRKLKIYKDSTKYVGFVGNLVEVKRADKLGEIFHYIANKVKNVKFIVVGDGPLLSKVEKETKDLDIIFTGRLDQKDVAKWMNAMDVMILPSRNEGFGAVVIEAQACGTAVVGSSNGGIPEAIGFDEFVVEEGENFERRFADKVIEVLKNGYDSKILIERVKDYTWESIVRKEVEVYKEVLNENTHSIDR